VPDSSRLAGPLAVAGAGGLLLYSGISNKGVLSALRGLLHGQAPSTAAAGAPITGSGTTASGSSSGSAPAGNTGASTASAAANQALARMLAVSLGHPDWIVGQQWQDWLSLWNQESNWQDEANPTSSARGIAQNINGYGPGYEQGNMPQQITWGINYIAQRYGSPSAAWAHEIADGWY
jgi:hypothetical protein